MHKIKVRGVIYFDHKIFLVRDVKKHFYYLPWGTLEWDETFQECLIREIQEELWIKPIIWKVLNIEEFYNASWLYLDIWFEVLNYQDFEYIDKNNTTHWFEYYDEWFYDLKDLSWKDVRPWNLAKILENAPNISVIGW